MAFRQEGLTEKFYLLLIKKLEQYIYTENGLIQRATLLEI